MSVEDAASQGGVVPEGEVSERLKKAVRDIPDFPKEGILFRDITTLLLDPEQLAAAGIGVESKGTVDKIAALANQVLDKTAGGNKQCVTLSLRGSRHKVLWSALSPPVPSCLPYMNTSDIPLLKVEWFETVTRLRLMCSLMILD